MNRHSGDDAFRQAGDWVVRTARANPEALLVLAAGCALLMRGTARSSAAPSSASPRQVYRSSDFEDRNKTDRWSEGVSRAAGKAGAYASDAASSVSDAAGRMSGYASDAAGRVSGYASDAGNRVADYASETGQRVADSASTYASSLQRNLADGASAVSDYASEVGRNISERASAVSDYAGDMGRSMADQAHRFSDGTRAAVESSFGYVLREQPLAIAVIGLAAGASLAALFPRTEVEAKAFRPAGEAIADTAAKVKNNLMESAGEAGERIKQRAAERGLNTEGLKEMAQEVAGAFTGKPSAAGSDRGTSETAGKTAGGRP
jgi:hypothetical protein